MGNSWSFLYDELNMSNQDYWEEDGFSIVGNPGTASPDIINFTDYSDVTIAGGEGTDTISCYGANDFLAGAAMDTIFGAAGSDTISFDLNMPETKNNKYKYSEDTILKELQDYISGTYNAHYSAGDDKIQTLDLIEACGDGESFCRSNILKYASRYDKKGTARRDIMKILHYAVLLMHFNDKNAQRETYPQ